MWKAFLALVRAIFGKKKPKPDKPDLPDVQEFVKVWICWDNQGFLSRWDCREGVLMEFKKGFEPTKLCKIDHTPEPIIEYVYVDVCKSSFLLPNQYCPLDKVEGSKKYIKGDEPKNKCGVHKKPIPQVEYEYHDVCIDSGLLKDLYCPDDRVLNKRFTKGSPDIPDTFCTFHKKPPDPEPKKLKIINRKLLYGDVDKFCGASDRLALLKKTGEHGFDPWPQDYQFEDYEQDLIDSGINYVRHIGSMDYSFLKRHCQNMKDNNIVVEIEVYDPALLDFPFVEIDKMGELAKLGNVLFDVGNEFLNYEPAIDIVIDICKDLTKQGCLVGAGAWSGEEGKGYSETFHNRYSGHDYEPHHRHWVPSHWKRTLEYGKPVMWNEFFNLTDMTLADVELLIKQAFQSGCQGVQYYCWFDPPDTLAFKDVLNIAGKLLK